MSTRSHPYKSATIEAQITGVITEGENAGKRATVTLYRAYASAGYKTGYQAVPKRWLEVRREDWRKPWRKSFTGHNYEKARAWFDDAAGIIGPAPVPEVGAFPCAYASGDC